MTDQIVWEDPPPPFATNGRPPVWGGRLAPLREHPGRWANLGEHHKSSVSMINKGRFDGIEAGEFEARTVGIKDTSRCILYVRYVGQANKVRAVS